MARRYIAAGPQFSVTLMTVLKGSGRRGKTGACSPPWTAGFCVQPNILSIVVFTGHWGGPEVSLTLIRGLTSSVDNPTHNTFMAGAGTAAFT